MPSYLFAGGEDADFTSIGGVGVDTTAANRRASYSRCALKVASVAVGDGWNAAFAAASSLWLTARALFTNNVNVGSSVASRIITLKDGSTARLALIATGAAFNATSAWSYRLVKITAAGASTTLATASGTIATGLVQKLDMFVNYAVAGACQVYVDGTKIIDYAGDVTTDSATTLSGFALGTPVVDGATGQTFWSECIVSDSDTRGLSLATLPPLAAGNTAAWTGAVTDVNETTLSDTTVITSATAAQVEEFTVTPPAVITGTVPIRAVVVAARASKGATGPQNLQAVVRTGAADFTSANLAVTTALARVAANWATNPNTGLAWTAADLTAAGFNIGLKSIA